MLAGRLHVDARQQRREAHGPGSLNRQSKPVPQDPLTFEDRIVVDEDNALDVSLADLESKIADTTRRQSVGSDASSGRVGRLPRRSGR